MPPRRLSLVLLAALAVVAAGCVRFEPVSLYAGVEPAAPPERPRLLELAVEPVIFADDDETLWFMDDENCTQGRVVSDPVAEGDRAIAVSWNRGAPGCEWAGLGFGWDDWLGKDLSEVLPYAAVQMRVRAQEGTMYGLPIVLTLEDYAGGMGFAYTGNRWFERPLIDEAWQTVTVPLAAFDLDVENLDAGNVKQLMLELQGSGSLYIDDVRLVFYQEEPQTPWLVEPPRPSPVALPITLFDDAFINDHGWGLVEDDCQSITLSSANPAEGARALHVRWDVRPADCYEAAMGVSWDRWNPVDVTPIADAAALRFAVRLPEGRADALPIRVGLSDYGRRLSTVTLGGGWVEGGAYTDAWRTVTIPFSELQGSADLTDVKQLVFHFDETGEVFIDDLRLVSR